MPASYNYDLRCKVIEAVKQGKRKIEVCRMLNMSRNTLDQWLKREEQTGDCRAMTGFQQGNCHQITDWIDPEALIKMIVIEIPELAPVVYFKGVESTSHTS